MAKRPESERVREAGSRVWNLCQQWWENHQMERVRKTMEGLEDWAEDLHRLIGKKRSVGDLESEVPKFKPQPIICQSLPGDNFSLLLGFSFFVSKMKMLYL